MDEFAPLLLMATLIGKILDLAKYIRVGNLNAVVTQIVGFVAGVVVVMLAAQTNYASEIVLGDLSLADANIATQIFLGLLATSLFSALYDFKKAFDSTDTAATPSLTTLAHQRSSPDDYPLDPIFDEEPDSGPTI